MRESIYAPSGAPAKGPYAHAVSCSGQLLFVSGQGPVDPATGEFTGTTFEEQAVRTFENLGAILRAAGADFPDVVKVNAYLADLGNFGTFNEIYRRYFREPYPARTTVHSALVGFLIEVDCVAVLP